jgi:hypothetical protein
MFWGLIDADWRSIILSMLRFYRTRGGMCGGAQFDSLGETFDKALQKYNNPVPV